MNTLPPKPKTLRKVRKAIPQLPDHLSHIPIEICSESITFRLKPLLKERILQRASRQGVSMTKILLWGMDHFLAQPIPKEVKE
jgi:hypothetical protein